MDIPDSVVDCSTCCDTVTGASCPVHTGDMGAWAWVPRSGPLPTPQTERLAFPLGLWCSARCSLWVFTCMRTRDGVRGVPWPRHMGVFAEESGGDGGTVRSPGRHPLASALVYWPLPPRPRTKGVTAASRGAGARAP